jgi:primosomal replication protein N
VAAARCAGCNQFLKWLPRGLVQPSLGKEARVMGGVNRVVLVGAIGKYGIEVKYSTNGSPYASFMLVVTEQGQDGKDHPTLIPCEVWGKKAENASELDAGQCVVFEGTLRKRPKGEGQWDMVVSGFELTPVLAPAQLSSN